SSVRHAQNAGAVVLERERGWLIVPLIAGAAGPRCGRVATLRHEALDDAVKGRSIVIAVSRERLRVVDRDRGRRIAVPIGVQLGQVVEHVAAPGAIAQVDRRGVRAVRLEPGDVVVYGERAVVLAERRVARDVAVLLARHWP